MSFWPILFLLFMFMGCASNEVARHVASEEKLISPSPVDFKKSFVQVFPTVNSDEAPSYYFYVVLKDERGRYTDCDASEIGLKTSKGKNISFKFERIFRGRYYLNLKKKSDINSEELNFYVQGKALKEKFKLYLNPPDKDHSSIRFLKKNRKSLTFELKIFDKKNRPVVPPESPEIILDGAGEIQNLRPIREGVWQFSIIYPEQNQILYLSVRSMGVYMTDLFRYQHVEK